MTDQFDGDLGLFNNLTHGEISVNNGQAKMDQGLETAVFISLYSGLKSEYWANTLNTDADFSMGGEYEVLAEQLSPSVQSAERLIEAILNDLKWMKNKGIAVNIEVSAELIGAKEILFNILITRPTGEAESIRFSNNWEGQFNNPASVGIE